MINYTAVGAFYVLFAIIGTIANIGVIVTILKSSKLRTSGMYFPVIMLSVIDFLNAVFISSIGAYQSLNFVAVSCDLRLAMGYMGYVFDAITMYGMVLLYVNHIIHIKTPNETRQKHCGIAWTLVVLLGCTIIFAVTVNSLRISYIASCVVMLSKSSGIGLMVGVYFLPLAILCLGGIVMIVMHSANNGHQPPLMNSNSLSTQPLSQGRFPAHLIVAGFIVSFTAGPSAILSVMGYVGVIGSLYVNLLIGFGMFASSKCCLLPFVWILDPDYRMSLGSLFGKSNNLVHTQAPMVAYNNYNPSNPQIGYGTPQQNAYGNPPVGYAPPSTGYAPPSTGYGNPQNMYGTPQNGYGTPKNGYGPSQTGYEKPFSEFGEQSNHPSSSPEKKG